MSRIASKVASQKCVSRDFFLAIPVDNWVDRR